jgi:DNA-binding MarR family transcriptional regulator
LSEGKGFSDEPLADQVFEALVRLFWGARQHSQSLKRDHGVTAAQLSALRVLERHGPKTHSQLSSLLFLRGSTVSGMVDRLESRELVTRERSPVDRRQVVVSLADAGRELLERIPKGQSKFGKLRQLVGQLPEDEARAFLETLNKILGLMGQEGLVSSDPSLTASGDDL